MQAVVPSIAGCRQQNRRQQVLTQLLARGLCSTPFFSFHVILPCYSPFRFISERHILLLIFPFFGSPVISLSAGRSLPWSGPTCRFTTRNAAAHAPPSKGMCVDGIMESTGHLDLDTWAQAALCCEGFSMCWRMFSSPWLLSLAIRVVVPCLGIIVNVSRQYCPEEVTPG